MGNGDIIVLVGAIVHSISLGELEMFPRGALVADNGVIVRVEDLSKKTSAMDELLEELNSANDDKKVIVQDFGENLIVPGFIDTHCHAPQYVFTGTGMDLPLLQWLEKYTFPCESRFKDEDFARKGLQKISQGTLGERIHLLLLLRNHSHLHCHYTGWYAKSSDSVLISVKSVWIAILLIFT